MGKESLAEMIGTQIGSYRLVKLLGAGGMGRVYAAEHVVMKDLWAVKVLAEELTQRPEIVARFVDEARAAAKVRHRNLVRVYQIEQAPNGGPWYMVLEYLEGGTLGSFIASHGGPVPRDLIVRIVCQIANALRVIHKHGIIHRDMKPENVFLTQRDADNMFPIVLDLGVAHLGEELARGPGTQAGLVIGTPSYMPPEQLLGEKVSPAADLFSLGVLAYEMSTGGWLPYQHDSESRDSYHRLTVAELYRRQTSGSPVDPRRRFAGMTDAWAKALLAPLDPDPAKRPRTEREYVLMLAKAAPTDGVVQDGLELVRDHAAELLQVDNMLETIRAATPAIVSTSGSETRYALGTKLGAGGMAEVFLATQLGVAGFERPVAIKRVLPELSAQPGFAAMFISEARIASRLAHPNVVSVTDFREDEQHRLFLVMEYIEGKDLAALLESGPISPSIVIYIMIELLRGLGYAHDRLDPVNGTRGVIHRDVSPHNVLLSYEGEVKVSDFGLARARDAGGHAASMTVRGKPSYMSPEQVNGEPLDNRSDLFAAGVMLWEMLAHRPLFTGSIREVMAQVLFKDIPVPSSVRGDVPGDLSAVAMKLLARERDARFPSAEAAIADLLRCGDARLDGRDELVRILAERFPRAGEASAPRRTGSAATAASRARRAEQITAPAVPSTLGNAASQSTPRSIPRPARRSRALFVGILAAMVGTGVGLAIYARGDHAKDLPSTRSRLDGGNIAMSNDDAPIAMLDGDTSIAMLNGDAPIAPPTLDAAASSAISKPDAAIANLSPSDARMADDATRLVVNVPHDAAATDPRPVRDAEGSGSNKASIRVVTKADRLGELSIIVKPWALVWINGKSVGQTPYHGKLPVGRYRIRLANEDTGKDETTTAVVTLDQTTTIQRTW